MEACVFLAHDVGPGGRVSGTSRRGAAGAQSGKNSPTSRRGPHFAAQGAQQISGGGQSLRIAPPRDSLDGGAAFANRFEILRDLPFLIPNLRRRTLQEVRSVEIEAFTAADPKMIRQDGFKSGVRRLDFGDTRRY